MALNRTGDRCSFGGLMTCGSVWACPACAARIEAERARELVALVEAAHAAGVRIAMVTLTMRHHAGGRLAAMWDALSDAWAAAMGRDRASRRAKAALGVVGWVRRVEATHGAAGWHVHAHALIFFENAGDVEDETDALEDAMWAAWVRRLGVHGLDADRGPGIELQELDLARAREEVGRYLSKSTYEAAARASAARELSGQLTKDARRGNRSPFAVLDDLVTAGGTGRDLTLWWEWEAASKGRRALTWSVGLRDRFPVAPERTDEELAAAPDAGDTVCYMRVDAWRELGRRRLRMDLLEAVELVAPAGSYQAAAAFMDAHGLPPPARPPGLAM